MKQDALERAAISDATRDREAAIDLIEFCVEGLRADCMSEELRLYLAGCLEKVLQAVDDGEQLCQLGKKGSVQSAFGTAVVNAFNLNRPASRPRAPIPDWQIPYAAFGALLLKHGFSPEKTRNAMSDVRESIEGEGKTFERKAAWRILQTFSALRHMNDDDLKHLATPNLCQKLSDFLTQT